MACRRGVLEGRGTHQSEFIRQHGCYRLGKEIDAAKENDHFSVNTKKEKDNHILRVTILIYTILIF